MKKLISILSIAIIVISLTACQSKTPNVTPSSIPTSNEIKEVSYISTEEAIECFKKDIHADIAGYTLNHDGYLSGPEGGIGNIHTLGVEVTDYDKICDFKDARYYINDNVICKYQFGSLTGTYDFGDSIYCGYFYPGFVLRDGNKVKVISEESFEEEIIATGVKTVLTCDYRYSSDFMGILLLMEDNTIKVKISDTDELLDIAYEGGYEGTYIEGYYI